MWHTSRICQSQESEWYCSYQLHYPNTQLIYFFHVSMYSPIIINLHQGSQTDWRPGGHIRPKSCFPPASMTTVTTTLTQNTLGPKTRFTLLILWSNQSNYFLSETTNAWNRWAGGRAHLFGPLPPFHRTDWQTESGSAGDVWNIHVVVQPLVPPWMYNKNILSNRHPYEANIK